MPVKTACAPVARTCCALRSPRRADISGWVTIENNTGTAFAKANVKLLAGDPRVDYSQIPYGFGHDYYKMVRTRPPTIRFGDDKSRAFGDYRMYTLPESTTVGNNQIKQIELITAAKVPLTKSYVYDGAKLQWYRHGYHWDAGYGTGDSCSAYGNRNFYNYFTDWFGETAQAAGSPYGNLEIVSAEPGYFRVAGWAIDPDTASPIEVHIYVRGVGIPLVANGSRPDVGAVNPNSGSLHGFDVKVPFGPFGSGMYWRKNRASGESRFCGI